MADRSFFGGHFVVINTTINQSAHQRTVFNTFSEPRYASVSTYSMQVFLRKASKSTQMHLYFHIALGFRQFPVTCSTQMPSRVNQSPPNLEALGN